MKSLLLTIVTIVLMVGLVSATETTLSEDDLSMEPNDLEVVEFCLYQDGVPLDVDVEIDPVCKDLNGLYGCQDDDELFPSDFYVDPSDGFTGEDGCDNLTIETVAADGQYYYTVNGLVGESKIGSETGHVEVPEFTVIAAAGLLGLMGLYVFWSRKKE